MTHPVVSLDRMYIGYLLLHPWDGWIDQKIIDVFFSIFLRLRMAKMGYEHTNRTGLSKVLPVIFCPKHACLFHKKALF